MKIGNEKITFITSSLGNGGAERVSSVLAKGLCDYGFDVSMILLKNARRMYSMPERIHVETISNSSSRYVAYLEKNLFLKNALKKLGTETIIILDHGWEIVERLHLYKDYRVVVSERSFPPRAYSLSSFKKKQKLFERAEKVVFQTEEAQSCYSDAVIEKSIIIDNPVIDGLPERPSLISNRIVAVGRLNDAKNYHMLLESFASFRTLIGKDYRLDIYGEGVLEDDLKRTASHLDISSNVNFFPFTANVHEEIKDAKMYISTSNYEGMQNSLLEAMVMGIPCIATDCEGGGARRVICGGSSGLLVPRNDVDALLNAMMNIATDDKLASALSQAGHARKSNYQKEKICAQWNAYLMDE